MHKDFCATAYILYESKVLLLFHKKLQKWLPPGGHLNEGETPDAAAIREAFEETGLHIELTLQENLWIDRHNATSLPRPYLILLENIPAWQDVPAHQHIDFVYLAKPLGIPILTNPENHKLRWFSKEDLLSLIPEEDIFQETLETLFHLLTPTLQPI